MISLPTFRGVLSSFSPLSLAPALWLNDTGSDPSVWTDMSGNGRHAVQATGANQPSIVTNVINGRQVRRFNGATTRLIPPDFNLDNCTVFSVVNPNVSTPIPNAIFGIGDSAGNGRDILVYFNLNASILSSSVIRNIIGGPYPIASALAANSTKQIATCKYTGTQLISYVNNGTRGIISATNIGSTTNKPSIGASIDSTGTVFFYTGDIAELIVYPSSLSDFNCLQVERYLSKKYNIAIA